MSTNPEDDAPYIPERYRQQIEEKARNRRIRKIGIAVFILAVAVIGIYILLGSFSAVPEYSVRASPTLSPVTAITTTSISSAPPSLTQAISQTPLPETGTIQPTINSTPATGPDSPVIISAEALAAQQVPGVMSVDAETALLREDFPAPVYRLFSVNASDTPSGRKLYIFGIKPVESASADPVTFISLDAFTGNPYVPAEETAKITARQATAIASEAFSQLNPDRVGVRFITGTGVSPVWNVTLYQKGAVVLAGSLDSGTGQITAFTKIPVLQGRPASPVLDIAAAQQVADRYIADQNGPVSINMSIARYDSFGTSGSLLAGQYLFQYHRLVQGYPCDADGFTIAVDSVSGDINAYTRIWDTPEFAFVVSPQPVVLKRDATYSVLKKAQDTYPGLSSGVRIISAEIRWKDSHPAGTVLHPASIPLAWKVMFDDELMRKQPGSVPAVAWIDIETGNMLEFDYRN